MTAVEPETEQSAADAKAAALQEAERELHAERKGLASGLAGARELRWMAVFCLILLAPVFGGPYTLASHHATLVCYYGAIIGFVVSGWGMLRSMYSAKHGKSIFRLVAMLYVAFFLFLTVLYATLMLSPTLDKRWIFLWSPLPGKPVYAPDSPRRK